MKKNSSLCVLLFYGVYLQHISFVVPCSAVGCSCGLFFGKCFRFMNEYKNLWYVRCSYKAQTARYLLIIHILFPYNSYIFWYFQLKKYSVSFCLQNVNYYVTEPISKTSRFILGGKLFIYSDGLSCGFALWHCCYSIECVLMETER